MEKHFAMLPQCKAFLLHQHVVKCAPATMGFVVAQTSTKRKCVLRRDVVNTLAPPSAITTLDAMLPLPTAGIDPLIEVADDASYIVSNDDEFEANANGWEDFCLVVTPPSVRLTHHNFMHTNDQKWTIDLLKVLDDMNAPDYAFADILTWAREANAANYSFHPAGGLSRSQSIDLLFDAMPNARQLLPSIVPVTCHNGSLSNVVVFDFVPQLLSLLQNPEIMQQCNLVIDVNCPLKPYANPTTVLGEALSGSVYREAYARYITKPHRQLFVPIIQWIDRTHVTGNARFSLKPYMFTPAIFTERFRRTIKAWGYHGFLPKVKRSSAQNQMERQGDPIRNYHLQLRAVLEPFAAANARLRNITLPLGPTQSISVDIVTCILFIIQDMQEGDMLCGRYGTHTKGIQRHCRACNVNYANLDNHLVQCTYLSADVMHKIALTGDVETRKRWSQHQLDNAFNSVPLADPVRGIFGATPCETMHCFRKGMIEMVTFLVLKNVPVSKRAALDRLAIHFHKTHRQTYRKMFPATDFSQGITNLTNISAAERLGLVFLFVIIFQYPEGWSILDTALHLRSKQATLSKILELFEGMLCLDAWLNQDTYWRLPDTDEAKASFLYSLRKLMKWCTTRIPVRDELGAKWNFPKFHELLHLVDDMIRFGASTNFCAQRPESLLILAAKKPGRRAQKRHGNSKYELQAAQRLAYSCMIDTVHSRIWKKSTITAPATGKIFESTGHASFCTLTRSPSLVMPQNFDHTYKWDTQTDLTSMSLPKELLRFLCNDFGDRVRIATEYRRDVYTFRCHPNFQSDGPIYDWMLVKFAGFQDNYPCRLAAVVINEAFDGTDVKSRKYKLVVQSTTKRLAKKSSVLLSEWLWQPFPYYVIDTDDIVAPCFVISVVDDHSVVLETKARHLWPAEFTSIFK